jgi:EAL domain-containing protein (putative c-di-GMP-specific phosphodiesterase class I)/GGDEF domain-containing protein
MRTWAQSRGGRIFLLGALGLLLQQIPVSYTTTLFGVTEGASLLHLHIGLILAIAMLERDRWVLAGVVAVVFVGWVVRAWVADYDMAANLPIGAASYAFNFGWALLCAHWMGWPKPHGQVRVAKQDLAKFAGIGLLLFPLGLTAMALLSGAHLSFAERMSSAIQVLFAKHFGVAVLTFPLVMACCERQAPRPRDFVLSEWLLPTLLFVGVMAGIVASERVQSAFMALGERPSVLMDYRFAVFALLGWCALRLRPLFSMPILSATMFLLVHALAGVAERNGTTTGFINLVHLAFELSVLLMAMLYFLVFERDTSELAARLEQESRRDSATGLPNLAALRYDLDHGRLPPAPGEVGFLVLDHSDDLVAGFGLDMQSRVMNTVATRLNELCEPFLVGMGQFALLPNAAVTDTDYWVRVIDAVGAIEVDSDGQRFGLSPYLGVARWTGATPDAVETSLLRASQLAFEARRGNEMRPLRDLDAASPQSGAMRKQLHAASAALACLRSRQVELHFQPIRPLDAAHPLSQAPEYAVGEVLCRLRGRQGQLLYPDDFLAAIEAVGRNIELDLAVLSNLFEQLRRHPRALPRIQHIAINLTGQSLASLDFRRQFERLLADSPLPLSALCFEITENAVIASESHTRSFLDELRKDGCRIAIDDFGKGMQSFARLKELPVDIIKIDGAFVRQVAERGRDFALVEASVSIARAFDAETVAEFVETEATADCLRELGVIWMQGYLYAQPKPLEGLLAAAE